MPCDAMRCDATPTDERGEQPYHTDGYSAGVQSRGNPLRARASTEPLRGRPRSRGGVRVVWGVRVLGWEPHARRFSLGVGGGGGRGGDLAIHLLQLGGQRIALTEHLPSSTHATARIQESADWQHVATCCDMLQRRTCDPRKAVSSGGTLLVLVRSVWESVGFVQRCDAATRFCGVQGTLRVSRRWCSTFSRSSASRTEWNAAIFAARCSTCRSSDAAGQTRLHNTTPTTSYGQTGAGRGGGWVRGSRTAWRSSSGSGALPPGTAGSSWAGAAASAGRITACAFSVLRALFVLANAAAGV
jgi:hypothetical protein